MSHQSIQKAKELSVEVGITSYFIMHAESGKTTEQASAALGMTIDNILKMLILYAPQENKYVGGYYPWL